MNKTRGKSKGGLSMRFSVWLTLAPVLAALPALAEPVPLAAGGQPRATLVVEPNADPLVSGAADDLQQYVKAICGVELPRRNDGAAVDGKALYIGACASTPSGAFPPGDANPETYAITVRDGNLFLTGNHPPATSFAVYSLIQDNLGVRWFAPGPLWEFVPHGQAGELTLEVENRVVTPDWSCRVWSGHDCAPSWGQWNRRNKTICVAPVPFRNMQNFLHTVFDPAKYAETHPEYYPLIDGKRWIPSENYRNWRPCESNPEVIRITVEAAREFLDAHPEHNGFSLAMDDIYHLCGCDACRALDARPDDYENKRFSDRHYKFVNAVARELAQTHPGKYVGTLCYHIARELPETVDRLEPNVFISMTQRVGEWWRPGQRDDDIALTHAWRERCSHMSRYGYIGLGFLTPRIFPHAMAEGMKLDHSLGFEAVYNECYTILPNVAPMMYMMARLQWDTDLDPDALLDEFYARMFGEAAVTMKACYDTLERSYMEPRPDRLELARWGHRHLLTHSLALSEEALDQAEALMAQALAEADTPEARARIEIVGASLQYAGYIIRAGSWARAMAGEEISTAEQAQAVLDRLERLIALSEEREQFWAAALERDDLLGDSLRGLKQRGYFVVNQISEVEAPASACLGQALTVLYAHAPEAASATIARIAASGPNPLAEQAAGWLVELRGEAPNLLKNAGFQEWAASDPLPEDWSSWSRTGGARFIRGEERGRDGSTAAAIARADGACYMQHVPVTPGQKYLCSVWASCDTPGAATAAALGVRWQTGDGAWHPDRECEPRTALTVRGGRWERLSVIATVPDGAARMVFMLNAEGQTGEHAVVFDDAAVLQLSE